MQCKTPTCQKWWTCCTVTFRMLWVWSAILVWHITDFTCRALHPLRPAVRVPHTLDFQIYYSPVTLTAPTAWKKPSTSEKNSSNFSYKSFQEEEGMSEETKRCNCSGTSKLVTGVIWLFSVLSGTGVHRAQLFSWVPYDNTWLKCPKWSSQGMKRTASNQSGRKS